MKLLSISLAAAALLAAPAAAQKTYPDGRIGDWFIGGADGACTAGMMQGDAMVLLVSADGPNEGAIFVTSPSIKQGLGSADWSALRLTVDGVDVTGEGSVSDDPPGYFFLFSMYSQMTKLGDTPRIVVTRNGQRLVDATLNDVKRIVGELLRCDAQVS